MRAVFALTVLALVGGCSSRQASDDEWTHWVCDSQVDLLWRFAGSDQESVDLRLGGSDVVHRLKLERTGSGNLFTDGNLALHTKGDEGLVYWATTDDLIGRGCRAP